MSIYLPILNLTNWPLLYMYTGHASWNGHKMGAKIIFIQNYKNVKADSSKFVLSNNIIWGRRDVANIDTCYYLKCIYFSAKTDSYL